MPVYEYRILDSQGKLQLGLLEADSPRALRAKLKAQGWVILEVKSVDAIKSSHKPSYKNLPLFSWHFYVSCVKNFFHQRKNRLKHAELTLFTRQLCTLIVAGLPIEEALTGLLEQTEKPHIKRLLAAIKAKIIDGYALSAALEQFPQNFSKLYVASITAGEQTGRLGEVLSQLADHLEVQFALYQKMTQALVYPMAMLTISFGIVGFLLAYVVPKIIEVFQENNQALPFLTQVLLSLSQLFQQYGLVFLGCILCIIFICRASLKKPSVKYKYDDRMLKLPWLGYFIKISNTARFSRTLGILVKTGVPVLESFYIALGVIERLPMLDSLKTAAQSIKEGCAIHAAIKQTSYFNPMSVYLIANGEATGKLEMMLEKMAQYQEQELTRVINVGLSLFEPILILVMGAFILFIVLAILLPIFSYNQMIG